MGPFQNIKRIYQAMLGSGYAWPAASSSGNLLARVRHIDESLAVASGFPYNANGVTSFGIDCTRTGVYGPSNGLGLDTEKAGYIYHTKSTAGFANIYPAQKSAIAGRPSGWVIDAGASQTVVGHATISGVYPSLSQSARVASGDSTFNYKARYSYPGKISTAPYELTSPTKLRLQTLIIPTTLTPTSGASWSRSIFIGWGATPGTGAAITGNYHDETDANLDNLAYVGIRVAPNVSTSWQAITSKGSGAGLTRANLGGAVAHNTVYKIDMTWEASLLTVNINGTTYTQSTNLPSLANCETLGTDGLLPMVGMTTYDTVAGLTEIEYLYDWAE